MGLNYLSINLFIKIAQLSFIAKYLLINFKIILPYNTFSQLAHFHLWNITVLVELTLRSQLRAILNNNNMRIMVLLIYINF